MAHGDTQGKKNTIVCLAKNWWYSQEGEEEKEEKDEDEEIRWNFVSRRQCSTPLQSRCAQGCECQIF